MNNRIGRRAGLAAALVIAAAAMTGLADNSKAAPPSGGSAAAKPEAKKAETASAPYLLDTCPVSGEKLGGMGKPVVKVYDGREVRFCCAGCIGEFEKDKAASFKKLDEQIIKQQLPHYPLKACVVMPDDELVDEGDGKAVDFVYQNRLVRFCCAGCVKKFKADPASYLKKLDEAVIAEQKPNYPLDVDVVTGEKLGPGAIDKVYGVTLVRFADAGSIAKFDADPTTAIAKLHEAWKAKHPHG